MSETTVPGSLFEALAALQTRLPKIGKGETAKVPGKDGKQGYTYKYADLADVSAEVLPLMGALGLSFTSRPTLIDGQFVLAYSLMHVAGEREDGMYPLPSGGSPQQIGSAITYARRYCLCAVTGVAPDSDDDDAAAAEDRHQRSAGDVFDNAVPAQRPANGRGPRSGRASAEAPQETQAAADQGWLDDALARAASIPDAQGCRALWKESAEKAHAGQCTKDDALRVQEILRARIEDLGRAAQQRAAVLDPEDPWSAKVEGLAGDEEAAAAVAELRELFQGGQMDAARADRIFAAIRARFPQAADEARKAA
jgi:hypothetical protein